MLAADDDADDCGNMAAADDDAADDCGIMADDEEEEVEADCGGGRVAALAETWRGMRRALRSAENRKQSD